VHTLNKGDNKLNNSNLYTFNEWNILNGKNKKYLRQCTKDFSKRDSMNCYIEYFNNCWRAEFPELFLKDQENGVFIKNIKDFKELPNAVIWVDTNLSKYNFMLIQKPLIFNWY